MYWQILFWILFVLSIILVWLLVITMSRLDRAVDILKEIEIMYGIKIEARGKKIAWYVPVPRRAVVTQATDKVVEMKRK